MSASDFTTSITVDQSPEEVFHAVNNPRAWWSMEIEGSTDKLDDVFNYHYKDVHRCKMKVVEMVRNEKVAWQVLENYFDFTDDKTEWTGTKIIFQITKQGNNALLSFTHQGLVPEYECYTVCFDAWSNYIKNSLRNLIATGKGQPNQKEFQVS